MGDKSPESVCLAKQTDIQACIPACKSMLKVSRSSSKVKGQGQHPLVACIGGNISVVTEAVSTEDVASLHYLPRLHCSFFLIIIHSTPYDEL